MSDTTEYTTQIAQQNETFDSLSYRLYGEERMSKYIRACNRQFSDTVVFEGGEELKVPLLSQSESTETLPPWRR